MKTKIGVRWDDESQNSRFLQAKKHKSIEFIEVNYPIAKRERPCDIGLPIYAHSANNALCSAFGLNWDLAKMVRSEANKYHSPWIGEHLAWLGTQKVGALGYVLNPIYNEEFFDITVENALKLKNYYGRPLALELGPQYNLLGDFNSEIDFLIQVSKKTNCPIILDLSHLMISNYNLRRPLDFGIKELQKENVVEVHVSGIRKSQSTNFWHDCHEINPNKETLELLAILKKTYQNIMAITLEHSMESSEQSFFKALEGVHNA